MTHHESNHNGIIKSINPATLEVNAQIEATPADRLKAIVGAAREAQEAWAAAGIDHRIGHLMKVKDLIISDMDRVTRVITMDNGKTLLEALNSEIYPVLDMFRFCAKDARRVLGGEKLSNPMFQLARLESENVFEPRGVIGIISPWNFPFAIPMTQILPALTAGNAVVVKVAEITSWVGELIKNLFEEAGVPRGVVNVVQGPGSVIGGAMMASGLDKLSFTGSIPVGKQLMAQAAEILLPITLELGGKDPFIVLADADVERAAAAAVWGAFLNAGQVCASVERVYVHEKVVEKFTRLVVEKTEKLRIGNGLHPDVDVGPMISEEQFRKVEAHVADAVAKGARVNTGGKRAQGLAGWFYEPTVLTGVNHGMDCMTDETFGPTLPIMSFTTVDEAVAFANDTRYGLTASVWTKNLDKGRALCRRIKSGTVVVNNCVFTYGFAQCPWGGEKQSGIGRTHSIHGLLDFTSIKNITVNKGLMKEDIWWYPYNEAKYKGMKSAMKTLYCGGMACRASGIAGIAGALSSDGRGGKKALKT